MKKKTMLLILFVLLLVLIVFLIALLSGTEGQIEETESTTQPTELSTQPATQPEEVWPAEVFIEGAFTFTAGQLYARFQNTLPEGYGLVEDMEDSPDNGLQLRVMDTVKKDTGITISMDTHDPKAKFNQLMLVAEADCDVDTFFTLLDWYVSTFLTGMSDDQRGSICGTFRDLFVSQASDSKVFATDAQTAVMARFDQRDSQRYYVIIVIH